MNNYPLKQTIVSFFLALMLVSPSLLVPAMASDDLRTTLTQGVQNSINTGNNVAANAHENTSTQTTVNNTNSAAVNQHVDAVANTGNNEASRNISIGGNAGIIMTGDATVNTQQLVRANTNGTAISGQPQAEALRQSILNTGDNASTSSSSDSQQKTVVNSANALVVNQSANTTANTGNNVADRNISIGGQAGVILTGKATTNTSYLVAGNGSVALVGGSENGNGPGSGASIILTNTGSDSRFSNSHTATNTTAVNNTNAATVSQSCGSMYGSCTAVTGGNTSDRGISRGGNAGVIQTADATITALLFASVNSNTTNIGATQGGLLGLMDILNTGDNARTNQSTNSTNSTLVNNTNEAAVDQNLRAVADTGNNHANRNISIGGDAGVILTGNALINAITVADVNGNGTQVGTVKQ